MDTDQHQQDINELMIRRREEHDLLRARGFNPYPFAFDRTATSDEILASFKDDAPAWTVAVAGRIMSLRRMGKASFFHVEDSKGRIQVYLKQDDLGAAYDAFKLMDIGDLVGVTGFVFRTKTGEVSIHGKELTLLSKSLRPLPIAKEKIDEQGNRTVYDPLADKELRYRQRYVDLIVNRNIREVFAQRARIVSTLRQSLDAKGYLEVETPVLQPQYGGAFARPFVTHHNALDIDLYLRIADELYLKRLIVGGFDGVYEISKDFRNEGMDKNHNPEFTMLEVYVAYRDYLWMMGLVEEMIGRVAHTLHGSLMIERNGKRIDFTPPWERLTMFQAIEKHTGHSLRGLDDEALRRVAREVHVDVAPADGAGRIIDEIFSTCVEPKLIQPTFITDYPLSMSPLAKQHRSEAGLVERFEVICDGQELCNAFSELNDPLDQRQRFEQQMKARARGEEEIQPLDEDYLRALEYGMPPTAGMGMGIDRLTMLMTGQDSIRDVIFFPQMKPEL